MSRQSTNDFGQSTRPLDFTPGSSRKLTKPRHSPSPSRLSPGIGPKPRCSSHRSFHQRSRRGLGSPRLSVFSDEETTHTSADDDDDDAGYETHLPGIKLPIPTRSMQAPKHHRHPPKKASKAAGAKKDRVRRERKSTVRKQRFDELESDSDLTDIPSSDGSDAASRLDKGKGKGSDLSMSDSDTEMEKKLLEAGDGESLLGSEGEDGVEEEERFIIRDALKREARARAKVRKGLAAQHARNHHDWNSRGDTEHRARSSTIEVAYAASGRDQSNQTGNEGEGEGEGEADVEDVDDGGDEDGEGADADADLLSLSPKTMRLYGLPFIEDEIFEQQEGFHTSSEPSFTDFFESSTEGDTAAGDGARDDDDEFTTDSETDEDISDLEGGVLEAPLIAHIGAPQSLDVQPNGDGDATALHPDVPLLVIEDLDGRLIYARAGDGEAVFGSDGEFEFVDETEDESTDYEYDEHGNRGGRDLNSMGMLVPPEDDGDTTDELPDEDMPYPRLLVGSVAPRGGRNSRRARALAAKSRRLSPASGLQSSMPSPSAKEPVELPLRAGTDGASVPEQAGAVASEMASSSSASPVEPQQPLEVDLTISTDDLARDPEGTLKAAAEALGLTLEEAANLVAGVQLPPSISSGKEVAPMGSATIAGNPDGIATSSVQPPRTPEVTRTSSFAKPEMGSFMPTSSKSVHRAFIDGSRQAPSPFSDKRSLQKRGLAKKRSATRRSSLNSHLAKRQRRLAGDAGSALEELSELAASSPEPEPVDPMDLDEVVNSNMLWRGNSSKSPSPEAYGSAAETDDTMAGVTRSAPSQGRPGINLNAFARWDRIPMGTFRDSQRASSSFDTNQHTQPLGTFLLTRSQGRAQRRQEHSPFRTTSAAAGDVEMFSMSPIRPQPDVNADSLDLNTSGGRRRPLVISPVLFPTRSGDLVASGSSNNVSSHNAFNLERHVSLPQNRLSGIAPVALASNDSAGPGRITRREKRERKARRAALLAEAEADEVQSIISAQSEPSRSPNPGTPQLPDVGLEGKQDRSDSPATALPRMRITDASPTPRASPAPAATYASVARAASPLGHLDNGYSSSHHPGGPGATDPKDARVEGGHGDQPGIGENRTSLLSTSGGLPSSACKTPLHSPLFGSIFGSIVDDLDEKEGENALTI